MVNFVFGVFFGFFFWPGVIWLLLFGRALLRGYRKRKRHQLELQRVERGVCPDCGGLCWEWVEFLRQRHLQRKPAAGLRN
jgi:hypothetical protein